MRRRAYKKRSRRRIAAGAKLIRIARERGFTDGYNVGRSSGYHFGICGALFGKYAQATYPIRDIHVMYVATGLGVPYSPIDEAVVESLSKMVSRLTVCVPTANISEIAQRERPDLMLVLNGMNFNKTHAEQVRKLGIRTAVWLTDDPYYTDATADFVPSYDYAFTLELSCVAFYRDLGCKNVHYLPFANDFRIYRPTPVDPSKRVDILFIGSGYWNRVRFFDSIAPYLSNKSVMIAGWWWDRLQNYRLLENKIRLGLWMTPQETAQFYNGAKIVINLHRAHDDESYNKNSRKVPAHSVNPRTFEISGNGAFQLSDVRLDLQNYYTPGAEIATYESPEEMIQKIDYYLAHEDERLHIARKGLKRTLSDHTYEKRLDALLSTIFG